MNQQIMTLTIQQDLQKLRLVLYSIVIPYKDKRHRNPVLACCFLIFLNKRSLIYHSIDQSTYKHLRTKKYENQLVTGGMTKRKRLQTYTTFSIYYNMNMCQHGQKITKFCITQHCHHKQSAGCDYCIRKYHFHLTNTLSLTEADVENLIKNITLPTDIKYKSRNLQQATIEYLRNVKVSFNNWIDQAQNSIADRLGHPTLRKQGLLNTYNRLKQKEYRKINAKELRSLSEFSKSVTPETLKKEQIAAYYEEVDWTANLLAAVEKVVLQISKLPEVKEGEGPIQVISKSKVNQVYQSIKRDKEKRDSQSQGLKLQENSLLKRRQSAEKPQTINNDPAAQLKTVLDRKIGDKLIEQPVKPRFLIGRQSSATQSINNKQAVQQKKTQLKRRRSSIDQRMDLKFGNANEGKTKQEKQAEQRASIKFEKTGKQRQRPQSQEITEKAQARKGFGRQVSIKVREDQTIMGNLLNSKYANKREEFMKRQQTSASEVSRQTTNYQKSQNTDLQKSEVSSYKASDKNVLWMLETVVNNVLPPPPSISRGNAQEPIKQKIVKIPLPPMNQVPDQIQSPIYKTKKKQENKQSSSPFGIILMPATDKVVEKVKQALLKPIAQSQAVQQSSVPALIKVPEKQNQKPKAKQLQKIQQKQDDLITLQKNQKNSLLLFSQALKSPGDRGIQLLKAALKYSPENLSAAQYLSYLYLEGGKAKECLEVCESILVKIQDTPEQFQLTLHLHNNKAAALNLLGRYSESIMILEKCLRFRRKHYFYKNLADAYFSLGIPEKAAMNYDKAIKLDPQSDEAFYNLAVTQFIQQQYTFAQLNIKEALKIQPMNQSYIQLSEQIEKRLSNLAM